jgi:hypothetical protein
MKEHPAHFGFDTTSMSYKAKWQKFGERDWEEIRDAWLANVPTFPSIGAPPDPGLEHLATLAAIGLPVGSAPYKLVPDVQGIRRLALWEAVFLFHKCSHIHLAAQRLGQQGMHSWCMFNAYHSAYLGARGIMELLGVALTRVGGRQAAIDLFIRGDSNTKKKAQQARRESGLPQFQEFLLVDLKSNLDQQDLWEGFQRVLKMSVIGCMDQGLRRELLGLSSGDITPPRNHFLYQAHFWPLADLVSDATLDEMDTLIGTHLDTTEEGFLLRLSFSVYRLFEQLMGDLSEHSPIIKTQFDGSRSWLNQAEPEFGRYRTFLAQTSLQTGATN